MRGTRSTNDAKLTVWAIGHVPPPVNGMTLLTAEVIRALSEAGPVAFCDFSPRSHRVDARTRLSRSVRTLGCVCRLIWNGRVADGRLYIMSNSRSGLVFTALIVWAGRRLGHRIFLHHHAYTYIEEHNRWMARIDRWMGPSGVHIVHCAKMSKDFQNQYPSTCGFEVIYPSVVSIDAGRPRDTVKSPFRLGMLSNLMISKGIDLAIETFETLRHSGRTVCLVLAGPIRCRAARDCVDKALKSYPDSVRYLGPVYGEEKARFFSDIDVFLFPTRYKEESWGIVLNEALAAGAPAITFNRGCTETVVGNRAGLVVPQGGDFVRSAADQIIEWMDNPHAFVTASRAAIEQSIHLSEVGASQLRQFAAQIHTSV